MPRKPYRSPRAWLVDEDPWLFGRYPVAHLSWRTPESDLDAALLAAAMQQSSLALTIRAVGGGRVSSQALAAAVDLHPDTVRDILNGTKHATLAVLHALAAAVGRDVAVSLVQSVPTRSPASRPQ